MFGVCDSARFLYEPYLQRLAAMYGIDIHNSEYSTDDAMSSAVLVVFLLFDRESKGAQVAPHADDLKIAYRYVILVPPHAKVSRVHDGVACNPRAP